MTNKPEVKKPEVKRIRVVLQLEGAMIDEDTALTERSAQDYFEMHFQCPKGLKAHVLESKDVTA
jgi:hypothetical protein